MHMLYIICCAIPTNENGDKLIPEILEKVWLQRHLLSDFLQKLIETNCGRIILNTKFHQVLCISSWVTFDAKYLSHTHTHPDRHFAETVRSWSGHPKMYKYIKNWKSKIFMKPILSSIYTEESKTIYLKNKI